MKKSAIKYVLKMKMPKIILWCYLIWYFSIMSIYFESSLRLWASSLGISLIIGFALILSTSQQGINQDIWIKIRLFLFPFCVSSYSATIKGHDFILLFPNNRTHLFIGIMNCMLFVCLIWIVKRVYKFYAKNKYSNLNQIAN
ncbi:MAG: hypothetical protein V4497_06735 [Bacteroidota bacterium]